ncbi:hypothetical protein [Brevibacillus nitrificans]|nr:hypothetical protein [Brevibacillus nitrificans]MDR7316211.1 hypothetical protein [Brevibacillus nitrificans]
MVTIRVAASDDAQIITTLMHEAFDKQFLHPALSWRQQSRYSRN